MGLQSVLTITIQYLLGLSKRKLVSAIEILRKRHFELESENKFLKQELERYKAEEEKRKIKAVNLKSNQPTSKQPEWELKGVGNDGHGKKKGRGKQSRLGAGNKAKSSLITRQETAKVEICDNCGADLSNEPVLESKNIRIIQDIPPVQIQPEVIEVVQEKKFCHSCKKVITAHSELALPKSDIGINTTIMLSYMWVSLCLPFTRISSYLTAFYGQTITTAGLSAHVIRVAKIMAPVYEEILDTIKSAGILHADETGWRVNGKNWWLWVFGTLDTAYYTIDSSRGKDVVRRVMGEIFTGVLVVDGWRAYMSLFCEQQTCMAHVLRKIRKLYKAFPDLVCVYQYYLKLRKILKDGEQLQLQRTELGEDTFNRRRNKLHQRLDALQSWENPNAVLQNIIEIVNRQRSRILTFVDHQGVPCHNNYAEYLIRIGVLKRKVSFGSKSAKGANAYAVLLSIYTTCKLRNIPFAGFMHQSLTHYIRFGKPMLFKEYLEKTQALATAA